ncbi:protease modulator HflC [Myxococcus sp. CA051A]|uniref:Protein HflC n=1 Tax=Myxococcus llanfairpwllgwyngyllgogerychwyrndrobwllllantysiliogogogochensis TaxID=2590453 RepID=A0A540WRB3_9BACT|nr:MULTISPECIES: protease modulator HflC [Myxococcus]NTX02439.1 protease modulator HflC [Myxococcus sp. CA040A]NTX17784.1 protease modulator HflC [Myxococcus sp. CA056]NTX39554.1 protease modulator HflC [Myxococcus sp. CA033]NTX54886.1 protease modulator HflC [Myxococcus sp. CA039A]NTX66184.1 protease modulator HflC [Myxococcus sp. CA051A]
MSRVALILVVVAALAVVLGFSSTYTLSEHEQAVITRFGQPRGQSITEPGLHFKQPFVDTVNRFDKRWLDWRGDPNQIPTKDKKYIWVDTFGRWRIVDPLRFFQRLRDERNAQSRLDDIIDGETRNTIASFALIEAVRSTNRPFEDDEYTTEAERGESLEQVSQGRDKLTRQIRDRAAEIVKEFGVELVDVQIRRINYVDEVQVKVFERMISERRRTAERSRSEGMGRAAEVRGQRERDLKEIRSEAYRKAQEITGTADAEATKIYADAFGRDPEFYQFMRTLEAYPQVVDRSTSLFLGSDSEFYRYLRSSAKK